MYSNIVKTKEFINKELKGVCSAHDLYHIERVYKISEKIFLEDKKGDKDIILLSALLHEMFDEKFFTGKIEIQKEKVFKLLNNLNLSNNQKEKIIYILENIGYGKSLSGKEINKFIEFQIVEDADRLESIGAIAIARTFAYGGKKHRSIYNPNIKFELNITEEQYRNHEGTSINHFYEKLLKLKDLMNTPYGKRLADDRHIFMEKFLNQFMGEWEGKF